jgi:hypothetical protein
MNSAPEVRLFVARLAPSWLARDLTIRMPRPLLDSAV